MRVTVFWRDLWLAMPNTNLFDRRGGLLKITIWAAAILIYGNEQVGSSLP